MIEQLLAAGHLTEDEAITRRRPAGVRGSQRRAVIPMGWGRGCCSKPCRRARRSRTGSTSISMWETERDAVIASCLERGATKLWDGQQGPQTWVTLADPEGNEFCVSE